MRPLWQDFLTGAEVRVGVPHVVAVHVELAVVGVPVDVRHVAVAIPRAAYCLTPSMPVCVYLCVHADGHSPETLARVS